MNSTGHKRVVELVNSQLTIKLPDEKLLAGSIDPDVSIYDSYTGIESKHHYDEGTGRGRPHTARDIQKIVYQRCLIARQHWLSNDRNRAAFHFGVATHYYMDGFICSPSIDENGHRQGDYQFTKTVAKTTAPAVNVTSFEINTNDVVKQIQKLSSSFGENDTGIVKNALEVLITIGECLTAANIPPRFPASLQEILNDYSTRIASSTNDFQEKFLDGNAYIFLLSTFIQQSVKKSLESSFAMRFTLTAYCLDSNNKRSILSVFFFIVRGHFRLGIKKESCKAFDSLVDQYTELSRSAYTKSCSSMQQVSMADTDWYSRGDMDQIRKKVLGEACSINDQYLALSQKLKRKKHDIVDSQLAMAESSILLQTMKDGRDPWKDKLVSRIGKECLDTPFLKYACSSLPLLLPIFFMFLPPHEISILLVLLSLCLSVCIWIIAFMCQVISSALYEKIIFDCPKCLAKVEVWRIKNEQNTTCPECSQKVKLVHQKRGGK